MSTPQGGDAKRLGGIPYKVIGGAVIGLAILVAVVPLWWGGSGKKRSDVIRIDPDKVATPGGSAPKEAGPTGGEAKGGPKGSGKGTDAGKKGGQAKKSAKEDGQTASGGSAGGEEKTPWWKQGASGPTPDAGGKSAGRKGRSTTENAPTEGPMAQASDKMADKAAEPEGGSDSAPEGGTGEVSGSGGEAKESEPAKKQAGARKSAPGADKGGAAEGGSGEETETPDRPWRIMSGSFRDPANARQRRDRIREEGFEAEVVQANVNGEQWNRVYVGKLPSRKKAQAHKRELKRAGLENLLIMRTDG